MPKLNALTKRALALCAVLLLAPHAWGQFVGGPLQGCSATPSTGTGWTSATSGNTTQVLANNTAAANVLVQLQQGTTLTGGAVTFEGTYDGTNWVSVPVAQVLNPNSNFAVLTNPYTLVASTNQPFFIVMDGFVSVRLKLSTVITGSGTITPLTTANCNQATQSTSLDKVAGSAVATAATGVAKVGLLGNAGAALDQAPGSAVPANALQVGGSDGTNTRVEYMDPCKFSAWTYYVVNVSSNTQIVAGSSSKNVYVCKMFVQPVAAATNVEIVESATSGNACATSPTGMMGGATAATGGQLAINGGFVLPADGRAWAKTATAADAMCIFTSAAVTGVVAYVQF